MVCGRYTYILQYRIHIYSIPWGFETETNKHNWGVQPTPSGRWQPSSVGDLTLWMEEVLRQLVDGLSRYNPSIYRVS